MRHVYWWGILVALSFSAVGQTTLKTFKLDEPIAERGVAVCLAQEDAIAVQEVASKGNQEATKAIFQAMALARKCGIDADLYVYRRQVYHKQTDRLYTVYETEWLLHEGKVYVLLIDWIHQTNDV